MTVCNGTLLNIFQKFILRDKKFSTYFWFDYECLDSFNLIKNKLVIAPVIIAPNWDNSFELMHDASDYSSKVLNENKVNYSTTEKELVF